MVTGSEVIGRIGGDKWRVGGDDEALEYNLDVLVKKVYRIANVIKEMSNSYFLNI